MDGLLVIHSPFWDFTNQVSVNIFRYIQIFINIILSQFTNETKIRVWYTHFSDDWLVGRYFIFFRSVDFSLFSMVYAFLLDWLVQQVCFFAMEDRSRGQATQTIDYGIQTNEAYFLKNKFISIYKWIKFYKKIFKIDYFNILINRVLDSFESRFEQFQRYVIFFLDFCSLFKK